MLKKIFKFICVISVLLIIGVGILLLNLNPILARLKPELTRVISDAIQQPVALGELGLKLFPSVRLSVDDVAILSEGPSPASVKRLELNTSIRGLIKGEVAVDSLSIIDAKVRLERDANGRVHLGAIELAKAKDEATSQTPPPPAAEDPATAPETSSAVPSSRPSDPTTVGPPETPPTESPEIVDAKEDAPSVRFSLRDARIEGAEITWIDSAVSPPVTLEIEDLSLRALNVGFGEKGEIDLSASILGISKNNLKLKGSIELAQAGLPASELTLGWSSIDLEKFAQLLGSYGVALGDVRLSDSASIDVDLSTGSQGITVSPKLDATSAGIQVAQAFNKVANIPLSLTLNAKPTLVGIVDLHDVLLILGANKLSIPKVRIDPKKGTSFTLDKSRVDLANLASLLPMLASYKIGGAVSITATDVEIPQGAKPQQIKSKGSLQLENVTAVVPKKEGANGSGLPLIIPAAEIAFENNRIEVRSLSAKIAEQNLALNGNFGPLPTLAGTLELLSERLALAPLLKASTGSVPPALESSFLSKLNLNVVLPPPGNAGTLRLTVGKSELAGTPFDDASLNSRFTLKDGALDTAVLEKSVLKLFGGSLSVSGSLRERSLVAATLEGSGINLNEVVSTFMPGSKYSIKGTMESLNSRFTLKDSALDTAVLDKSLLKLFGGSLSISGSLRERSLVAATLEGSGINLNEVVSTFMPGSKYSIKGTMESLRTNITTDINSPMPSLQGPFGLQVGKGEISGINLLKETLEKVSSIPGVSGSLANYIPERFDSVMQAEGTEFDSLMLQSTLGNNAAKIEQLRLEHPIYQVTGGGTAGFDGKLNLDIQLRLTETVTKELILKNPKLQLLVDRDGTLTIPVLVKKDGSVPVVLPDVSKLAANAARNTAKEAGRKAIDKVAPGLGGALDSLFK